MSDMKQPSAETENTAYDNYEQWKGWNDLFSHTSDQAQYFSKECKFSKISDADVLEIGFGSGTFLSWAKSQSARVSGTEINPVLIEAAQENGVHILPADFETVAQDNRDKFDTVVAFDVFEHFSLEAISLRLTAIRTMLKPEGILILRFPNGQSPFGLGPQHGDPTHITPLSKDKLEPYLRRDGWQVISYRESAAVGTPNIIRNIVRGCRKGMRKLIARILSFTYATAHPWGPVVTLVLCRPED